MVNAALLNSLYARFNHSQFWETDPIAIPRLYTDSADQEWVALLASVLAYGRVSQIQKSVRSAIELLEGFHTRPLDVVDALKSDRALEKELDQRFLGWKHRFQVGSDIVSLLLWISEARGRSGSLGEDAARWMQPGSEHYGRVLDQWFYEARETLERKGRPMTGGLKYLFTPPENGSVCKRWNMYLRWMVRHDSVDLGGWQKYGFQPAKLMMPLDTHTARICAYLGLRDRKTLDWQAVEEVTRNLKKFSPDDPVRYDFALARLGIMEMCTLKNTPEVCSRCDLAAGCRYRMNEV